MLPTLDELRRELELLIDEKARQGAAVAGLKEELARLPDSYDALAAFWQRLLALPLPPQCPPAAPAAPPPAKAGASEHRSRITDHGSVPPQPGQPPRSTRLPQARLPRASPVERPGASEPFSARGVMCRSRKGRAAFSPGPLLRAWAMLVLAVRRLISQPGLTLAGVLGVASAAILVMSVPVYVDAAYRRLLREELMARPGGQDRPPFSFMFHYVGSLAGPLPLASMDQADGYLAEPLLADLGLPGALRVRSLRSDRFGLYGRGATDLGNPLSRLTTVRFGTLTNLEKHIEVSEGALPRAAVANSEPLEALLSQALAYQMGIEAGETFIAFADRGGKSYQIPVRITGIWHAGDRRADYWFSDPSTFDDTLLVPEETFRSLLADKLDGQVNEAIWYLLTDGSGIGTRDVAPLIVRIQRVQAVVATLLPRVIMSSPLEALQRYYGAARSLSTHLHIFSTPIVGLSLFFTGLVTGMGVERRRGEIAILRSRGATGLQIVGVALLEGLVLGLVAIAVALPGSLVAAHLATRTRSFLDLTASRGLPVVQSEAAVQAGLLAVAFGVLMQVLPALRAARHTIVTYRQEQARLLVPPLWQRMGLDLLLLIPAGYGTYLLKRQGRLFLPQAGATTSDPFQNPLLVLVPSFTILALTLAAIRALPRAMAGLAWVAARTRSLSFLVAARNLARMPGPYAAPMVLLIVTLSLSVFLSATAQTLDAHLYDQARYQVGAEMIVGPALESRRGEEAEAAAPGQPGGRGIDIPDWYYVPVSDYLRVPGVQQVARVDRYVASLREGGGKGSLLAVDGAGFAQVAFWRPDYAGESLGMLMNRLAQAPNAVDPLLPGRQRGAGPHPAHAGAFYLDGYAGPLRPLWPAFVGALPALRHALAPAPAA